ncbi:MAG: hypothetical protein FVQ82_08585 [Planctomycetes bacterium]|nr:hypothetical protein [Planctomycetota bacterium]
MKHITIVFVYTVFFLMVLLSQAVIAGQKALSTSPFVEVSYEKRDGYVLQSLDNRKTTLSGAYISVGIDKLTVNKKDSIIRLIVDKNRHAFAMVTLNANYNSQPLSISKISVPMLLKRPHSSLDMGVKWIMLYRIPWVLHNAKLKVRLAYTADSTATALINAFSGITSAIPDYTISTSLTAGLAITSTADKLLFDSDRAIDLLNAERDLPVLAGDQLREGYYAIFAAENNSLYQKYCEENGLVWTGNNLEFNGQAINDVCYAVISIRVTDRYYASPGYAINDITRSWSGKYREALTYSFDLTYLLTSEDIDSTNRKITNNLIEAITLLGADLDIIQQEKYEIHKYVRDQIMEKLKSVKKRIDAEKKITKVSTATAIMSAINTNTQFVDKSSVSIAERLLKDIPDFDKELAPNLKDAIADIESVISID